MSRRTNYNSNKGANSSLKTNNTSNHPAESNPDHISFLQRSLEHNDRDIAAVIELNKTLHILKDQIVKHCSELTLLDLGEGLLRLSPDGGEFLVRVRPSHLNTIIECTKENTDNIPVNTVRESISSTQQSLEKTKDDTFFYDRFNFDEIFKDELCLDFLLRMKLRRRLLSRVARRLLRIASAMDGNDVSPPVPPKYAELRLEIDDHQVEIFTDHIKRQDAVLRRMQERQEFPGLSNDTLINGDTFGQDNITSKIQSSNALSSSNSHGSFTNIKPEQAVSTAFLSQGINFDPFDLVTKNSIDSRTEDFSKGKDYNELIRGNSDTVHTDKMSKVICNQSFESESPNTNALDYKVRDYFETRRHILLDEGYELLKDYKDSFEKEISSRTGELVGYTIAKGNQPFQIENQMEPKSPSRSNEGVGNTGEKVEANQKMTAKERELEWKRYKDAIISRIPKQPTYNELGLEYFCFYGKERRERALEYLKQKMLENPPNTNEELDKGNLQADRKNVKLEVTEKDESSVHSTPKYTTGLRNNDHGGELLTSKFLLDATEGESFFQKDQSKAAELLVPSEILSQHFEPNRVDLETNNIDQSKESIPKDDNQLDLSITGATRDSTFKSEGEIFKTKSDNPESVLYLPLKTECVEDTDHKIVCKESQNVVKEEVLEPVSKTDNPSVDGCNNQLHNLKPVVDSFTRGLKTSLGQDVTLNTPFEGSENQDKILPYFGHENTCTGVTTGQTLTGYSSVSVKENGSIDDMMQIDSNNEDCSEILPQTSKMEIDDSGVKSIRTKEENSLSIVDIINDDVRTDVGKSSYVTSGTKQSIDSRMMMQAETFDGQKEDEQQTSSINISDDVTRVEKDPSPTLKLQRNSDTYTDKKTSAKEILQHVSEGLNFESKFESNEAKGISLNRISETLTLPQHEEGHYNSADWTTSKNDSDTKNVITFHNDGRDGITGAMDTKIVSESVPDDQETCHNAEADRNRRRSVTFSDINTEACRNNSDRMNTQTQQNEIDKKNVTDFVVSNSIVDAFEERKKSTTGTLEISGSQYRPISSMHSVGLSKSVGDEEKEHLKASPSVVDSFKKTPVPMHGNSDKQVPVQKNEEGTKKLRPISLVALPSFYDQDIKRIKLIHAELVSNSMELQGRRKLEECTNVYNIALKVSNEIYDKRVTLQNKLNSILAEERERQKMIQEYHVKFAVEKTRWDKKRVIFEQNKLNMLLPSRNGTYLTGTSYIQRYMTRSDHTGISHHVGNCLADVVDAVEHVTRNRIVLEKYKEKFKPPPDPYGNDPVTGESGLHRLQRVAKEIRLEIEQLGQKLRQSEENRSNAWKKMLKTKSEFSIPHDTGTGGTPKMTQLDLNATFTIPVPALRQTTTQSLLQTPSDPSKPTTGSYKPTARSTNPRRLQSQSDGSKAQTDDVSLSASGAAAESKYSAARVKERIAADGSVAPVSEPKMTKNGLYQRPAGRTRKGMEWDAVRGIWIPANSGTSIDEEDGS